MVDLRTRVNPEQAEIMGSGDLDANEPNWRRLHVARRTFVATMSDRLNTVERFARRRRHPLFVATRAKRRHGAWRGHGGHRLSGPHAGPVAPTFPLGMRTKADMRRQWTIPSLSLA